MCVTVQAVANVKLLKIEIFWDIKIKVALETYNL